MSLIAALTRFVRNLVLLLTLGLMVWVGGGFAYRTYKLRQGWPGGFDPATLPRLEPGLRVALLGRPVELPLKAAARLPVASSLKLKLIPVKDAGLRFQMLASGAADVTLASMDELALALPRFQPGLMVFPVAENRGNEGVVENEKSPNQVLGYLPGGTSEALARAVPAHHFSFMESESPDKLCEWLQNGQIRAASLWQPYLAQAQKNGAKLLLDTGRRPTIEVWVVSRRLLKDEVGGRASTEDVRTLAKAWFLFVEQLRSEGDLAAKALASQNDLKLEQAQAALTGLSFYTLNDLKGKAANWPSDAAKKLESELTFWSLAGAPSQKVGKLDDFVDSGLLRELTQDAPSDGPSDTPSTPVPMDSPTPENPESTPSPVSSASPSGAVAMAGGDAARSGLSPGPALVDFTQQAWLYATGGEINCGVTYASGQGLLLFGSDDKSLHALDAKTGGLKWKFPATDQIRSTPAVDSERVYFGCNDGRIYALNLSNGNKLWTYQAQGEVHSSPLVAGDSIYAASRDGGVFALDTSGKQLWTYTCPANVTSSPALREGLVVIGCQDGGVYALNAETGKKVWVFKTRGPVQATPCIVGDKVLIGSGDRTFYAIGLKTGKEIWNKKVEGEISFGAASSGTVVCFGSADANIYGLSVDSGKELWKCPTRERICSSPTICDGIAYIGSEDKRLWAVSLENGDIRFRHKIEGWVNTPLAVDGSLIFTSTDKNVYCLK